MHLCHCIRYFAKTTLFFVRAPGGPPQFPKQGTQIVTIGQPSVGFALRRGNAHVQTVRCSFSDASGPVKFYSVLGPLGCEVFGVGRRINGSLCFGRMPGHPSLPFFREHLNYSGARCFQNRCLSCICLDPQKSFIGVHT